MHIVIFERTFADLSQSFAQSNSLIYEINEDDDELDGSLFDDDDDDEKMGERRSLIQSTDALRTNEGDTQSKTSTCERYQTFCCCLISVGK